MRRTLGLAPSLAIASVLCLAIAGCGSSGSSTTASSSSGSGSSSSSSNSGSGSTTTAKLSGSPIHIEMLSFTIPGLDFLTPDNAGAQAAAAVINSEGGFGGRKLIVDKCNTELTSAGDISCAHSTLANKPVAEIGCDPFWASAGNPIYAAEGIPSFNCADSNADYSSKWEFSADPLEMNVAARFVCEMPNVKSVVFAAQADPIVEQEVPPQISAIFKACNKTVSEVFWPLTAVDMAPYAQKVLAAKPGFVMLQAGGTQYLQLMKAFQTDGWPADKTSVDSGTIDYENILKPGGSAVNGAYFLSYVADWDDTSNPQVATYLKATASLPDPKESNTEASYAEIMWIYSAAKSIGFSKFNAAALTNYMRTANGAPIPLSRAMVNPGPAGYVAIKQPDEQVLQWKGGTLSVVNPSNNGGWVSGLPASS
jgi:ABC-type branched-subunit amino acid transport system substrate-binding protein